MEIMLLLCCLFLDSSQHLVHSIPCLSKRLEFLFILLLQYDGIYLLQFLFLLFANPFEKSTPALQLFDKRFICFNDFAVFSNECLQSIGVDVLIGEMVVGVGKRRDAIELAVGCLLFIILGEDGGLKEFVHIDGCQYMNKQQKHHLGNQQLRLQLILVLSFVLLLSHIEQVLKYFFFIGQQKDQVFSSLLSVLWDIFFCEYPIFSMDYMTYFIFIYCQSLYLYNLCQSSLLQWHILSTYLLYKRAIDFLIRLTSQLRSFNLIRFSSQFFATLHINYLILYPQSLSNSFIHSTTIPNQPTFDCIWPYLLKHILSLDYSY